MIYTRLNPAQSFDDIAEKLKPGDKVTFGQGVFKGAKAIQWRDDVEISGVGIETVLEVPGVVVQAGSGVDRASLRNIALRNTDAGQKHLSINGKDIFVQNVYALGKGGFARFDGAVRPTLREVYQNNDACRDQFMYSGNNGVTDLVVENFDAVVPKGIGADKVGAYHGFRFHRHNGVTLRHGKIVDLSQYGGTPLGIHQAMNGQASIITIHDIDLFGPVELAIKPITFDDEKKAGRNPADLRIGTINITDSEFNVFNYFKVGAGAEVNMAGGVIRAVAAPTDKYDVSKIKGACLDLKGADQGVPAAKGVFRKVAFFGEQLLSGTALKNKANFRPDGCVFWQMRNGKLTKHKINKDWTVA